LICLGTTFLGYILGTVWHELAHIITAYVVRLELTEVTIKFQKGYTEQIIVDWDTKRYDRALARKLIITGVAPWSILVLVPTSCYFMYWGIMGLNFDMMTDGCLMCIMVLSALIPTESDRKLIKNVYKWYIRNGTSKELKTYLNEGDSDDI
jgi:hypothetical protein